MIERHKKLSESLFNIAAMSISENGSFSPLCLLVINNNFYPIIVEEKLKAQEYTSIAINAAYTENADALILICEQWVATLKPNDPIVKNIQEKKTTISELDNSELYLTLLYMSKEGILEGIIGRIYNDKNIPYVLDSKWIDNISTPLLVPWGDVKKTTVFQ